MAGYGGLLGKAWDFTKKTAQVVYEVSTTASKTPFEVIEIQKFPAKCGIWAGSQHPFQARTAL